MRNKCGGLVGLGSQTLWPLWSVVAFVFQKSCSSQPGCCLFVIERTVRTAQNLVLALSRSFSGVRIFNAQFSIFNVHCCRRMKLYPLSGKLTFALFCGTSVDVGQGSATELCGHCGPSWPSCPKIFFINSRVVVYL